MTCVLNSGGKWGLRHGRHRGEDHVKESGGRHRRDTSAHQGKSETARSRQELGERACKQFSLRYFDSQIFGLQKCERINSYYFKPFSFGEFVIAALGLVMWRHVTCVHEYWLSVTPPEIATAVDWWSRLSYPKCARN